MQHRHLNHQDYTRAAIDDIISRGQRSDWSELRRVAQRDPVVMERIQQVSRVRATDDPYAQRHHFWMHYAERLPA